jgi:hypothetical protein
MTFVMPIYNFIPAVEVLLATLRNNLWDKFKEHFREQFYLPAVEVLLAWVPLSFSGQ